VALSGYHYRVDLRRVVVLGSSGSGKSTFAAGLAARTGLPLFHLDHEYWLPGWVERCTLEAFTERVAEIAASERWIIDGNYSSSLPARLPRATAIFWLDLPRTVCLANVVRRVALNYGRVRPSMAPGCPERWDWGFLRFIWNWHTRSKPRQRGMLEQAEYAPRVQRFTSTRQARAWLAALPAQQEQALLELS
jgi:adenylate kinase family enzyme